MKSHSLQPMASGDVSVSISVSGIDNTGVALACARRANFAPEDVKSFSGNMDFDQRKDITQKRHPILGRRSYKVIGLVMLSLSTLSSC